jgi:kinetochore protein Spc24
VVSRGARRAAARPAPGAHTRRRSRSPPPPRLTGLTERVAGAEAAAAYPRPEGAHAARAEELAAAAASARAGVAELAAELAELGERRAALRAQLADLEARHARVEREVTAAEPHTRHLLSLYAHVSQISWHLDRPGRVAGDVSDPAAGDVRPFDLDPAAAPPPEVAARLWALMDGE